MDDFVAPCDEKLGDQAPVAAPPDRLGAHEARRRASERLGERLLPCGSPHPRGVAPEGSHAQAGEPLLARLAAEAAAELDRVLVHDAGLLERVTQRALVELWVAARAGKAADVDQRFDSGLLQRLNELFERPDSVANRERLVHTIAACMVGSGRHG